MDEDKEKNFIERTIGNLLALTVDTGFHLKLVALGLTVLTTLFWRIPDGGYSGMDGHSEEVLFAHASPGYLTVMFGLVVIFILGERPNRWFYYVFYISGIVMLLICGVLGFYNCLYTINDWGSPPLFMAACNVLTAVVLLVDLFWSTALFGVCDMVKKRLSKQEGEGDS